MTGGAPAMTRTEAAAGGALVAACWLVALLSALWVPEAGTGLCEQDQVPLRAGYRVDVTLSDGAEVSFCNPTCALLYLRGGGVKARSVTVRDETTGDPLDAGEAFFVESEVFTHRESANRIHVFADRAEAERHARHYGGGILPSPFAPYLP